MKKKEKQNKHKLKFNYIEQLQKLGKIWKEQCESVSSNISKNDKNYINEVIKLMSKNKRKEYCSVLDKCNDILPNIRKVDGSLKNSHKKFSDYRKLF
jgi:hypothetical protein